MKNKCTWEIYTDDQMSKCDDFCAGYMDFLSEGKTERECVEIIIKEAQAAGYRDLDELIEQSCSADGKETKSIASI